MTGKLSFTCCHDWSWLLMDTSPMWMGARLMTDRGPDRDLTLFYAPFPLWTLTETKCTNFAKMQPRIAAAAENCRDLRSCCTLCTLCRDRVPFSAVSTCIRCILVHQGIPRSVKLGKNQLFINKFLIMHLIGYLGNLQVVIDTNFLASKSQQLAISWIKAN